MKETEALYRFFSDKYGDIVDLNLDYFPEMIIVTFASHRDVLRGLALEQPPLFEDKWALVPSKIDFLCHVRNSERADDPPASKYLPIVFRPGRMELARAFFAGPNQH
jgi:hypothetical protein